jgi:hypothetical protein
MTIHSLQGRIPAVATTALLALSLVSCSPPTSSSGEAFATDGGYLSRLCGLPGDRTFTTVCKSDVFEVQPRKCPSDGRPPVWLRYYDGPNMFAKNNFEEISFSMPVTQRALPEVHNT